MEGRVVTFNVGGKVFATTLATLQSGGENLLLKLATGAGGVGVLRDDEGRIFVDRNPRLFEKVLEFLRSGGSVELADDALLAELRYFFPPPVTDVTIREALLGAHQRVLDTWIDEYGEHVHLMMRNVSSSLQTLAESRKLFAHDFVTQFWYASATLAEGGDGFPTQFGKKKSPQVMRHDGRAWFSDFQKTFSASHDGDTLVLLPLPTGELMTLAVAVAKHLRTHHLSVEVITLHERRKEDEHTEASEMRTAFGFFQRRVFGLRWCGNKQIP